MERIEDRVRVGDVVLGEGMFETERVSNLVQQGQPAVAALGRTGGDRRRGKKSRRQVEIVGDVAQIDRRLAERIRGAIALKGPIRDARFSGRAGLARVEAESDVGGCGFRSLNECDVAELLDKGERGFDRLLLARIERGDGVAAGAGPRSQERPGSQWPACPPARRYSSTDIRRLRADRRCNRKCHRFTAPSQPRRAAACGPIATCMGHLSPATKCQVGLRSRLSTRPTAIDFESLMRPRQSIRNDDNLL